MKIPEQHTDLRKYTRKKDLLRAVALPLWAAVGVLAGIDYNRRHMDATGENRLDGVRFTLWIAAFFLLGVVLFRGWKLFTDRARQGRLTDLRLSRDYAASADPGAHRSRERTYFLARYRRADGKSARFRFEQKDRFSAYYREGDRFVRFRGLPYPLNLDRTDETVCTACGVISPASERRCPDCGLSLILPSELPVSAEDFPEPDLPAGKAE